MKIRSQYSCPLELTHDITKGKWKPLILWLLGKGPCSFSKLFRDIKDISEKVLMEQLNELISFQMVTKELTAGYPLKSEYRLTLRGKRMLEAVSIMQEIGIEILSEKKTNPGPY